MAELIIDMTGVTGLSDDASGDMDMITPQVNKIVHRNSEVMAGGVYNPYLRNGYLAPSTTATTTITHGTTPPSQFRAVEYDHSAGEVILTDDTKGIYKLANLTDTSTELVQNLTFTDAFGTTSYEELYDAQIYSRNGERRLYVVGKSIPYGGSILDIATTTGTSSVVGNFSINPDGATKPSVIYSARQFTAAPGTSERITVTVPSGTNTCVFAISFWSNAYNAAYQYSYGDTVELTQLGKYILGPSYMASYLANPTPGTYDIQIASSGGGFSNLTMFVFVTDNTDQTNPVSFDGAKISTTNISRNFAYVDANQLNMAGVYSNGTISLQTDFTDDEAGTQAYGADVLTRYTGTNNGSGLSVASLSLPVGTDNAGFHTWLASRANGGFSQAITSDYAFMRTADNGFAYVFADNHVHKIDGGVTGGSDGTITKDVILFPSSFTITDAIDHQSRMYIALHQYPVTSTTTSLSNYNGKCGIYVWNRISTTFSSSDFIELPGVREVKKIYASPDGVLKMIVISENGLTEVRMFGYNDSGGAVFRGVKKLGIGAYPQLPDGLTSAGDKTMWIANDGYIYCEKGNAVTKLVELKAPGTTTATLANNIDTGIIFYGSGLETASSGYRSNKQGIIVSYVDSSTITNKKLYPFDLTNGSNSTQAPHAGNVYTTVRLMPITSIVRTVRVYNSPITTTGTTEIATVKLYFNQSSTVGMTKTITYDEAARGYVDFKINKPYVHSVQLEVEWNTGVAMSENMYMPSIAVVSYDTTDTKSPDNG